MKEGITFQVNDEDYDIYIKQKMTLLEALREEMDLTGTKEVCDMGSCGACTVLVDNKPVLSCLTLAVACKGKQVTTIEGLKKGNELHQLQKSFIEKGAIQCGMCTSGMILTGKVLLDENPEPTEHDVREAISGNLCRCTGYVKIVEAILDASNGDVIQD